MFVSTRDETDPQAFAHAAAMVFSLEAAPAVMKPFKIIEQSSPLYVPVTVDVEVENAFIYETKTTMAILHARLFSPTHCRFVLSLT